MARAYGLDLREKVIKSLECGEKEEEIGKNFKIGLRTVFRWKALWKETGEAKAKERGRKGYKVKIADLKDFEKFVNENNDLTQREMAIGYGCSQGTIQRGLKKIEFTVKKRRSVTGNGTKEKGDCL